MDLKNWCGYAKVYEPIAVASIDGSDKQPHDKAVVRALNSNYVPNVKLAGNPTNTLFVGRLHPLVKSEELEKVFSEYGSVKSCQVIRDIITGHSRQYGFVEFEKEHHALRAYRNAHKTIMRGAEILVDWEFGRTMPGWRPRSLGGGFGGRRESGQLRFGCRDRPWERPIVMGSQTHPRKSKDGHERTRAEVAHLIIEHLTGDL